MLTFSTMNGMTNVAPQGILNIPNPGRFLVSYGVYTNSGATEGDTIGVQLNTQLVPGTERPIVNNSGTFSTQLIDVPFVNMTLSLRVYSAGEVTFGDEKGFVGYINIVKVG